MKLRRQILAIAAASAVATALSLPATAAAEYYVPPANSAANQYTESFPGAGGERGGKGKGATPGKALGAGNAKKLEAKGPAGKAAAEVAAETAPPQLVDDGSGGSQGAGETGGNGQTGGNGADEKDSDESGSGAPGAGGSNGSSSGGGSGEGAASSAEQPQGSSGVGQVLGQATGVSDGDLGLWLPLAIVLTLIGSVAYWVRMRHAQPGHRA